MANRPEPYLCIAPACGSTCSGCNSAISPSDMRHFAVRYALLQRQDPRFGMPVEWLQAKTLDEAVDNELDKLAKAHPHCDPEEQAPATTPQPAIPPGFKVVPVIPTQAMAEAGTHARWTYALRSPNSSREIWASMLSAAPVPEAGQGLDRQRNQEIAELLLDNDREGSMKWARGIHVTWKEDGWEVSAPLASGYAAVFDAIGIGSDVRTPGVLLANVENLMRRTACLNAIEREFFTVPTPPDPDEGDDEPGEECLLNWGHDPAQYVEQFREALKSVSPPPQSAQPMACGLTSCPICERKAGSGLMEGKDAVRDVLAERQRQVTAEGYFPAHDDEHDKGELAVAAACYALRGNDPTLWITAGQRPCFGSRFLQRVESWVKSKNRRSNLVRAAALLLAEIERLDRAALSQGQQTEQGSRNG